MTIDDFKEYMKQNENWIKICNKADVSKEPLVYALQVPIEIVNFGIETTRGFMYANYTWSLNHGDGDYIISKIDEKTGMPDLTQLMVINNDIFINTFDFINKEV